MDTRVPALGLAANVSLHLQLASACAQNKANSSNKIAPPIFNVMLSRALCFRAGQ